MVPLLVLAVLFMWGGIAILGIVLIILSILVIVFDSWTNRPIKKSAPQGRDNRGNR